MAKQVLNHPLSLFRHRVTSSLYFVPGTIVTLSILCALGLLALTDSKSFQAVSEYWAGDMDSARQFLGTVAGATIGIAGVAFSVVIVALTLASNQFCPRVLEHFVEDTVNRIFFGLLLGNFSFALTILARLESEDKLPGLALIACFLYTLGATGYFIYFIHHLASSLQIDNIVRVVQIQTEIQIDNLKGDKFQLLGPAFPVLSTFGPKTSATNIIKSGRAGYIQTLDHDRLVSLSSTWGEPVQLVVGDGDYVVEDTPLTEPLRRQLSDQDIADFQSCLEMGHQRYLAEDISYGFRELVDIAVKAISPGINDPTTAVHCLDTLSSLMRSLLKDGWPSDTLERDGGKISLRRSRPHFYLRLCCLQIVHFGGNNPMVLHGVLHFLGRVAHLETSEEWRQEFERNVEEVVEVAKRGNLTPRLREDVEQIAKRLLEEVGLKRVNSDKASDSIE